MAPIFPGLHGIKSLNSATLHHLRPAAGRFDTGRGRPRVALHGTVANFSPPTSPQPCFLPQGEGSGDWQSMLSAPTTRAFALVEAVVAMGVMSIAAAALLLGINSAQQTTSQAEQQAIALGIAQRLLDEVTGTLIYTGGTAPGVPGTGTNRTLFTNVDSFNGLSSQPPLDPWGIALGTDNGTGGQRHANFFVPGGSLNRWLEQVSVYYVSPSNLSTPLAQGQTSNYRVVQVNVFYVDPTLGPVLRANVSQVVTYVPPMQ